MAAHRPDQARPGAAMISTPEVQVIPLPGRYEIDTSCSAVTFRTRHLFGLAPVRGSFRIRAGTIDVAEPLADSSVHVQIDPASFRTVRRFRRDPDPNDQCSIRRKAMCPLYRAPAG